MSKAAGLDEQTKIVRYTLAGKANNTLSTRLVPVTGYSSWRPTSDATWAPDEDDLYEYMKENTSAKQALSRARSTMKSFRFVLYVCRGQQS